LYAGVQWSALWVNLSWRCTAATGQRRLVGVKGGRACSAGIRSERVEALGGGRAYDLDTLW